MARSPGSIRWPTCSGSATSRDLNGNHENERPSSRARASWPERMELEESLHRLEGSRSHRTGDCRGQGGRQQAEGAGADVRHRIYLGAQARAARRSSDLTLAEIDQT